MKKILLFISFSIFIIACSFIDLNDNQFFEQNQYQISQPLVSATISRDNVKQQDFSVERLNLETNIIDSKLGGLVNDDDDQIKQIKNGIFQTVTTEIGIDGKIENIHFYTWQQDGIEKNIIDISTFNDEEMAHGVSIGLNYYQLWQDKQNFYLSYHDLNLDKHFLEAAKSGKMFSSNITIGSSVDEVIATVGKPIVTDWYHGGVYYFYNDIGFILDENTEVSAINLPGNRLNIPLNEVANILGEPTTISHFEYDNSFFYTYDIGNYTLSFEAANEDHKLNTVWLMKN